MKKNIGMNSSPYRIQPLLPSEPISDQLSDLCVTCMVKAHQLKSRLHPIVNDAIGDLVRTMNCYYSNLIEDHNTHPLDIERALHNQFATNPTIRDLQQEAIAHIELQQQIDRDEIPFALSTDYLLRLHKTFYHLMPTNFSTNITPGTFRKQEVQVGRHIAPSSNTITSFLNLAFDAYGAQKPGNQLEQIVASAASHHRLLWIHPFLDGNGRIIRLFSHAFLKHIGIGSSLWSIARGLARNRAKYRASLANADQVRMGDLDGRGNLSEKMLNQFCLFFLSTCLDQIEFMQQLIEPEKLLARIKLYCEEKQQADNLPDGAFLLLREALLVGEFSRGRAAHITGFKERKARNILRTCLANQLLTSPSSKGLVRLNFSVTNAKRWLPNLFDTG